MAQGSCRSGCGRRGSRSAPSGCRAARPATPSARPGIRRGRDSRRAGRRARRSPPPRGTCRPAGGRPYPRSAAGSWWRRARRSAGRADPAAVGGARSLHLGEERVDLGTRRACRRRAAAVQSVADSRDHGPWDRRFDWRQSCRPLRWPYRAAGAMPPARVVNTRRHAAAARGLDAAVLLACARRCDPQSKRSSPHGPSHSCARWRRCAAPSCSGGRRASGSRWFRPWARCMPATSRWCERRGAGRSGSWSRSSSIPRSSRPTRISRSYPRTLDADLAALAALAVDLVWAPAAR